MPLIRTKMIITKNGTTITNIYNSYYYDDDSCYSYDNTDKQGLSQPM